jgi:hypothetical protein
VRAKEFHNELLACAPKLFCIGEHRQPNPISQQYFGTVKAAPGPIGLRNVKVFEQEILVIATQLGNLPSAPVQADEILNTALESIP